MNAADALNRLAEQTDAVLLFPYDLAKARQANRIKGRFTLVEALDGLLAGTGLSGNLSDKQVIQISQAELLHDREATKPARASLVKRVTGFLEDAFSTPPAETDDARDESAGSSAARKLEEIIVTGSRIRRSAAETPTPTTMLTSASIEQAGAISAFDLLMEMPQIGNGSFSSENTSFSFGNAGLNAVALRNLGPRRTLTLIDGRRAIGTTDDQNFFAFDLSTLSTDIIDRVEIITGGASAIYGADAVAGVINVILKDDYEGLTARMQAGQSTAGDAGSYRASLTGGMNLNAGKDHVLFSLEHSDQDGLFFRDRENAGGTVRFISNPLDSGPADGIPDRIAVTGLRFVRFGIPSTTVEFFRNLDGSPAEVSNVFSFDRDGETFLAVPGDEVVDGFLTRNPFGGVPGSTDRAVVPLDRANLLLRWHRHLSDALSIKTTGRLSRTGSTDAIGPVFAVLSPLDAVFAANPFVPESLKTILEGDPSTQDDDIDTVFFSRQFDEFGPRGADITRHFRSLSVELEGQMTSGWSWDLYAQWGGTDTSNTNINDRLDARYAQALDAVVDPASGEVVCREATNGCVPLNPFLPAREISQAVVDFLTVDHTTKTRTRQLLVSAGISGDLAALPAGSAGLAAGMEYREDELDFRPSEVWRNAEGFFATQFAPVAKGTSVTEAYVELLLPVLSDVPLFRSLDLDTAVRVADYEASGTNTSWKIGASWRATDDVRLRAVRSHAVRAPSLGELFNAGSRGANDLSDPCDALNVTANANRQANCAALGIPPEFISATRTVTTLVFSTGNETLGVEDARTMTAGVVLTPRFVDRLELTVDYYDIDLKNGITRFGAQRTLDLCVDLPSLDNNFCPQVDRAGDGNIAEVRDTFINASGFRVRGLDVSGSYAIPLDAIGAPGSLRVNLVASKLSDLKFTEIVADDGAETFEGAGAAFDPKWRGTIDLTYEHGPFVGTWQSRYISGQLNDNDESIEFRRPSSIPSVWYHDLYGSVQLTNSLKVAGGVHNVLDKEPPLHPLTANGNNLYSITGRRVFLQLAYDVF